MAEKEDVSTDKTWSIKFSDPIDSSSLKDSSIYIMNNDSDIIDTNLKCQNDTVAVSPTANYSPYTEYFLYITKNVKSTLGKQLSSNTCLPFTIKVDALKLNEDNNNETINIKKGDKIQLSLTEHVDGAYYWIFRQNLNTSILKTIYDININTSPSNIIGSNIKRSWLIEAINSGSTTINLEELQFGKDRTQYSSKFHLNINVN
ncbi:Ig-like domain-containing protein [Clostridium sp. LBM24168]